MLTFILYQDKGGGWRWSLKAANNRIIADSAEAYATASNARRAASRVIVAILRGDYEISDPRRRG